MPVSHVIILGCVGVSGHSQVVAMLLQMKADHTSSDSNGATPLHYAAQNNFSVRHTTPTVLLSGDCGGVVVIRLQPVCCCQVTVEVLLPYDYSLCVVVRKLWRCCCHTTTACVLLSGDCGGVVVIQLQPVCCC